MIMHMPTSLRQKIGVQNVTVPCPTDLNRSLAVTKEKPPIVIGGFEKHLILRCYKKGLFGSRDRPFQPLRHLSKENNTHPDQKENCL